MMTSRKPPISASKKFQENENIVTWTDMHVMKHVFRRSETQLLTHSLTQSAAWNTVQQARPENVHTRAATSQKKCVVAGEVGFALPSVVPP